MREDIAIPEMRKVPRRQYRDFEVHRSASEQCAVMSEPVPAREVRGGDEVIGLAANPSRYRRDGWRVGRVLIRENSEGRTQIRIGFYGEWITWEGDSDTPIPVYRR
ncbi:hypothetical protein [Streptomyces viridochromogenes]|uniref:hypothetical protein n=1 Tax=Streptomyces viridochromogenes TaxID=1938 RepID=UPI00069D5F59|nr:hypothetical protein [Streptomyces viridochromogenes]KOG26803.1 hypothetical protein ADK36_02255 [Streptomyces viridochromogenes]